jgi:hypothetical protein
VSANNYVQFYQQLPIPWLTQGPNGQAEGASWPSVLDGQVNLAKQAVKARLPSYAPVDALPYIGRDRRLLQGAAETTASFRVRLRDVWGQWSRAGTACGVLEQIAYFLQSNGAVWVQQNGLQQKLTAMPTPGVDPTSLMSITDTATLSTTLTSTSPPYRTIPAGTPWFALNPNTDFCNCFAIIVPSWPFSSLVMANFNNSDCATVTWPVAFGNTTYSIIVGPPTAPVTLVVDGTTQTTTGVTIRASAPWTGSVAVIAYAAGVNPLNFFSSASFGALQSLINAFRPNAICVGLFAITSGTRTWDYFPAGTTWDGGTYPTWDTNSASQVLGVF